MKKVALILMICSILSKVLGFGRDIILSYFYGASYITDAYLISQTIPLTIFAFIGTGVATSYIPISTQIVSEKGEESCNKFTNNVINIGILLCTIIVCTVCIFTEPIVRVFAMGFEGDTLLLAKQLTRINIFGIYFSMLVYVFTGFLNHRGNFTIPGLVGVPLNIVTIISIIIASKTDEQILAIGGILAIMIQVLFMLPWMKKNKYKYQLKVDIKDIYLKKMLYLSMPVMLGVSVNQINVLVDRTVASSLAEGGISALNYAGRLNNFIQGIFVIPIATVIYPLISNMVQKKDMDGFKSNIRGAITAINLILIPATVGMIIFAEPIVRLLFGRGEFNSSAISMTQGALVFYSVGIIGFGLREILSRAFYALQDTKIPMRNATISIILNISLNLILSYKMGINGLALATSISAIVCSMLLMISLKRKIGRYGMQLITTNFIKMVVASIIMAVCALGVFRLLTATLSTEISLIVGIVIGIPVYFICIYFMKLQDVDTVITGIKNKVKNMF